MMTIHSLTVSILLSISTVAWLAFEPETARAVDAMNIKDFLDAAASAHETARLNDSQKVQYDAKREQAMSAVMPQVKAIGSYTRQDDSAGTVKSNASAAKLNLTQPLLGLYKNRASVDYADQQLDAINHAGQDAILQLKISISDAFYAVLTAKSDVENYQEVREIAMKRVKETKARVKIGRSRAADLYSAEAQLSAIEAQLEQAKTAEVNARLALAQLSGLPAETNIADSVTLPTSPNSLDHFLAGADGLPAMRGLESQKRAVGMQVESIRAQRIPDLDVFADYYLHREEPLDKVRWDVGLQLTWLIYDGGVIPAKVRESQAQWQSYDVQLSQKKRVATLKIRQNYEQFSAILRQMPMLAKTLTLAQKSYDSIEKDYRLGLTSILELIQSYNAVADAKRQQSHQVITAKAALTALQLNSGQQI